jgi:NAD(P)-dependent dehydrogenase (short-subunit alcohol dehydrogenase family)
MTTRKVDLSGRVALVTGASAGLGKRFAQVVAQAGASVVLCARRAQALEELAAQINADGGRALALPLDLRDTASFAAIFDKAEAEFGRVDILINAAAIPDANYATRLPIERINDVIDTDFRAPFVLSTELARRLIDAGAPGWVVNISSVGAISYSSRAAAALYSSVKAGITRMSETLAIEWAPYNINVNTIVPGMFLTEMSQGLFDRVGDKILSTYPRKRIGQPEYLDSTLLYLLDPDSHFVSGANIIVDDVQTTR